MFRNCADIKIISNVQHPPNIQLPRVPAPNAIYTNDLGNGQDSSSRAAVVRSTVCVPVPKHTNSTGMHEWCQENCLKYPPNCDPNYCHCLDECEAIGDLKGVEGTDVYCHRQCLVYPALNCPQDKCKCTSHSDSEIFF